MDEATGSRVDPVPATALAEWLAREVPEVADGPVQVTRISGGHSNLTYRVVDAAGTAWALRRPPTGGVLATAHDMGREWRFLVALAPTPVPVARPVAHCTDPAVIGAEFYLMGFVDGVVPADVDDGALIPEPARRAAGLACADVLADLHAVDPAAVGLDDLRRPGSYLERQLRRWHRQAHSAELPDPAALRAIDAAHDALLTRMPADVEPRIAHGDFRPGNLSFHPVGPDANTAWGIAAIFDWELATLGDPLADLGWLIASWGRPGDEVPEITSGPTTAPGWPGRDELVARYVERSGQGERVAAQLPYFVAFARWRVACIGAGVYTRYVAGVMGERPDDASLAARLASVRVQAQAALADLEGSAP